MGLYLSRTHRFTTFRAGQHGAEIMPAGFVPVQERGPLLTSIVFITPVNQADDNRVEPQTLLGKPIFMAQRGLAVGNFLKHIMIDQMLEPLCQNTPGNAETLLKLIKPPYPEKCFAQHQQRPAIPHHRHRARQGAILPIQILPLHVMSLSLT